MNIKRERKVRLDELLKYVWDNEIKNKDFLIVNGSGYIEIDSDGDFKMVGCDFIRKRNLFTITEEVEVKNDTVFDELVIIQTKHFDNHDNKIVCRVVNKSIAELKKTNRTTLHEVWTMKANGIGELIWDKEKGLL